MSHKTNYVEQLTKVDRAILAFLVNDVDYLSYTVPVIEESEKRLIQLGLTKPGADGEYGTLTPKGRKRWRHERQQWLAEHSIGAAYRG